MILQGAAVPKLVPRFILELEPQGMVDLVSSPSAAVKLLVEECTTQHYDGLVSSSSSHTAATSLYGSFFIMRSLVTRIASLLQHKP